MRILVTGGAGFIGSHLCDALVDRDYEVWCIDNLFLGKKRNIAHLESSPLFHFEKIDISDRAATEALFNDVKFDGVFHLAANSDIPAGISDFDLDNRLNFITTFEILRCMHSKGVKRLFFASSSAVFGESSDPLHEAYGPMEPISLYGASKLAAEAYISVFAHTFGLSATVLRFPNVTGERATHGVVFDFLNKLKTDPKNLEVMGDGQQSKPYLYVSDLVSAILLVWDKSGGPNDVYHAAGEDSTSVHEIAEIVVSLAGESDVEITYTGGDRGWPGDVPMFRYDTSKLAGLGWKPEFRSTDAVRHAVRRILENGF